MSEAGDGNQNPQNAKVLKLGLNISVTGDPGTDYEIVLDENKPKYMQSSLKNESQHQSSDLSESEEPQSSISKKELQEVNIEEVANAQAGGAISKQRNIKKMNQSDSPYLTESEKTGNADLNIIDRIKSTMEHFEKFSDHIKEVPRLRNCPIATSTPFSSKQNSKSESSLVHSDYRPGKLSHLYDFQTRKNYFKNSVKPLPPDLFLKPLPGENLYKRGIYSRYFDLEPYRHYASDNSLNQISDCKILCTNPKTEVEKYDPCNFSLDHPTGILKKSDSESGDKQSTSSADSIKDIKIYQSGGILIMQNFKDNISATEKKEMSDFSVKLIENCNKLKDEINSFQLNKPFLENSPEENKNSGKTVQFDLTNTESQKSKSGDSSCGAVKDEISFSKFESSESTSDCQKTKDNSPQGTFQSQDFPSLSTQENDSIISNQPGTSPTFVSPKKLEWDSGADIGYMNLDLTKENLSTIERIVLKGLSSDGVSEKNVVYEKTPDSNQTSRSKFILERIPSDLVFEEITSEKGNRESIPTSDSSNKDKEVVNAQGGTDAKRTRKNVVGTSEEGSIGENRLKFGQAKPSRDKSDKADVKGKKTKNKSINVNTLWEDASCEASRGQSTESLKPNENPTKVRSKKFSPKVKKSKKKRSPSLRAISLKDKTESSTGRHSKSYTDSSQEMGVSKKTYKSVEALPALNDVELSKGTEEIIIDQRYNDHQPTEEGEAAAEVPAGDKEEGKTDSKAKSRPISASSSSNKTVLPKTLDEEFPSAVERKFVNKIIQTNDLECESVGIQAFASQLSSDCDYKNCGREEKARNGRQSSKNIQAFGLNASLPKQLAHPKESTDSIVNQNTKSTQFFGGPVNSLPNYHSNLVTKPVESCGRVSNVLKAKKNLEAEIIRLNEENEKNILANDMPAPTDSKSDSRNPSINENKENLNNKTKKRSQSNSSRKTSKGNGSASQESEKKERKGKAQSVEGSEGLHTSDEVSSLILTSEVLKVHGDSIDRNIIQEKYFQSQMAEFQTRKMISRSTSMEIPEPDGETERRKYTTTGCQYSPLSKDTNSGERFKDNDSSKGKAHRPGRTTSEQYDSSQNVAEDGFETLKSTNQEPPSGAGDSLPSSTQTAHSWVPGMQNAGRNVSGVGKARSFEYLPGHIYESSGNLREELPSETEQNLITSSSDSDTAKRSLSDRAKESEGRNTLVLENSTESSHDSDRLKILDENLTQLNFAILKLQEKDAQVQIITRSLLANLWKKNGSGDGITLGEANASKAETLNNLLSSGKECGDSSSNSKELMKKKIREKEMSIACQTEEKSSCSEPEKFYEERKALEKRISEEKKCQIKWIENEIYHLNVLRELLEKQNSSRTRKKDSSVASDEGSKSDDFVENVSKGTLPRAATPVYGCTISVTDNPDFQATEDGPSQWYSSKESPKYGMTVSLSGKNRSKSWRRVVMLPVGVQMSLKDANIVDERALEKPNRENGCCSNQHSSKAYESKNAALQPSPCRHGGVAQSDVNTQYPSARRTSGNHSSVSIQADLSPSERCIHCNEENCVCLNLEKSYSSLSRSSRSRTSERRESSKLTSLSEEPELENDNQNAINNKLNNPPAEKHKNASDSSESHCRAKSNHGFNSKCQTIVDSKPDTPDNCRKQKLVQNPDCRCQNCCVQVSSNVNKSDCRCGHSNIYFNIDKSSNGSGGCRCCNIEAQKPSKSRCHIIKIHGSKCCSPQKGSCCCKNRNSVKKTENQSCQTDLVKFVAENQSGHSESVEDKSSERRKHSEQMQCPKCGCSSKDKKEKPPGKVDDHPRHYFLRIEETEVDDDSKEFLEQKKSLEVITVTVPLKKAGKSKIYKKKILEKNETYRDHENLLALPSRGCNCCTECAALRTKSLQDYEPLKNKVVAEKPQSPKRDCETEKTYGGVAYPSKEPCEELSSWDYCRDPSGFGQRDPYNMNRRGGGSPSSQCFDGCKCLRRSGVSGNIREIQSEYDSPKKSRSGQVKESYQEARLLEGRGNAEKQQRTFEESSVGRSTQGSRNSREQNVGREPDQYDYDYYNYNKREFMTKSELAKEEEKKQKVHQPSLQECLTSNRPDFYSSAERRRQIISERAKERVKKHSNRMECLMDLIHRCNERERASNGGPKRIFTTLQMREQTMKRYKRLPEVTGKLADQKKKEEYRTNKLMAEIFARKLQNEALKGQPGTCHQQNF